MPDHSNLPSPYESPWALLRRDLRAVVASLGLRARELWRRNREGSLPRPSLWPTTLAAWFWPLLLTAVLSLAVVTWLLLAPLVVRGARATGGQSRQVHGEGPVAVRVVPIESIAPAGPALPAASPAAPAEPLAQPKPTPTPTPTPAPLQIDPLLSLLTQEEGGSLILSARPEPDAGRLVLVLAPAFDALPQTRRQERSEQWLNRSQELGYDSLVLVDARGQALGRQALVGSGMILLSPPLGS